MPALSTKHLNKRFDGIHAVDGLSVSFAAGRITGIIGPNGSGKSTLVDLLTGMTQFDSGMAIVSETTTLQKIKPHEISSLGITRTFQEARLFEQMPVIDNILVVLTKRTVSGSLFEKHKEYHTEKAKEALEKVGLWEKRNELAADLSYGQRKLLEIARACAMNAEVYFFDEPFAGLFPEMIKVVTGVLKELREKGKTIVLVEHNMELIRELSDHCIVMDSGRLLAEGKPAEVLKRRDVIEAYLGE